ncbi:MAG: acetoacetate decarboxylase family protein [Gemmatimonadaceae bacterium]|nr:acetoacetate decarboxylase family protein [Gemmatimonadaceae bacterium]
MPRESPPTTNRPARPGSIPERGEVWLPVGPTHTLLTAHLVRIDAVRPMVPPPLRIVPVFPGYTLGATLLSYYGPESTLEYHELVVAGALVRAGRRVAPFVTQIYVDSADSVTGGRRMGLPKELATFAWRGTAPDEAHITRADGVPIARIAYGRARVGLEVTLGGPTITMIDGAPWRFRSTMRGHFGLCAAAVETDASSPLAPLALGRAPVAVLSGAMRGAMGLDLAPIGA